MSWISTTSQAMTWIEAGRTVYTFADASQAAEVRKVLEAQGEEPSRVYRQEGYWRFEVNTQEGTR
jgi:hypothetical protein